MAKVPSGATERLIPCAWADCERHGDDLYAITVPHGRVLETSIPRTLTYLFCSERHQELYRNSHRANGRLATGSRGLLAPR